VSYPVLLERGLGREESERSEERPPRGRDGSLCPLLSQGNSRVGHGLTHTSCQESGRFRRLFRLIAAELGTVLAAARAPQGPTEEHLVEELSGIVWCKRGLRLGEAAAHRRGLEDTLAPWRETAKAALVDVGEADPSWRVADAVRAVAADTHTDLADLAENETLTRRALELLGSQRNDAYEATLRERTRGPGGRTRWRAMPTNWTRTRRPPPPTPRACAASLRTRCCPGWRPGRWN
jgi:hypothetical protein